MRKHGRDPLTLIALSVTRYKAKMEYPLISGTTRQANSSSINIMGLGLAGILSLPGAGLAYKLLKA